jgi:hypothetical protein
MYLNPFVAVIVSSRLIKKKGLFRYLLEGIGLLPTGDVGYTQLVAWYGYREDATNC